MDVGALPETDSGNFNKVGNTFGVPTVAVPAGSVIDTTGALLDDVEIAAVTSFAGADPNIGPADPAALALGFTDTHLTSFGGTPLIVFVVFENLDPEFLYDLEVVAAYDLFNLNSTVRINGDPATDVLIDSTSATPFAIYEGLAVRTDAPAEPNSINIQVFGSNNDVINAIRLVAVAEVIPEPVALVGLVLGAWVVVLNRRRVG
ncbi:MAG: PEP-CTERM sorting domain-containing protein [Planctomycetota bacterium]